MPGAERAEELFAGKYRLIRMLGKGGMGEVWLAEEEGPRNFRRRVALKKLLSKSEIDDYAYESFFAEAHVIARLDHPNIVRLIELGVAEDTVFLALDYVDGPSLDRLVRKGGGPLSAPAVAYVGREVARALEAVHSLCDDDGQNFGVVHRDISPANILLARDARVRLTDFGIAKISGFVGEKTETGVFKGKLPYMPPEQARGEAFDQRADVFSLGVTLIESLTGRRVRKSETQAQLMMRVATAPVPSVQELLPDIPPALASAIDGATAFDPDSRTQDAGTLAAAFDAALWALGPSAEQEARAEIKRRVETTLAALGESVTGTHRQTPGNRSAGRGTPGAPTTPSAPRTPGAPVKTPKPAVSEIHARGVVVSSRPDEAGPPSSNSAPTVLERGGRRAAPDDGGLEAGRGSTPSLEPAVSRPSTKAATSLGAASSLEGASTRPSTATGKSPSERRRASLLLLLAVALGAAFAVFLLWWSQQTSRTQPSDAEASATSMPSDPLAPSGTGSPGAKEVPPGATAETASPSASYLPTTPSASASTPGSHPTGEPSTGSTAGEPKLFGKWPPTRGTAAPEASATATSGGAAEETSGTGSLQVVVLPWADVSVDGKPMGTTPIAPIPLSPGPHSVVLRNAELGAVRNLSVVIKAGQPSLLRVDLRRTESP
ncbi:uncharacterized protein CMC5_004760 [Chondromyces crocatus]|uniref:non-specific serine/threonine protein kinase n=2 Tax=Chondromyces crocatus TaxID=52 RepID=A0A0K1E709_CHOCO|nr:uncharacterized protein CMC5_004760 [Chondromyces crocatus]